MSSKVTPGAPSGSILLPSQQKGLTAYEEKVRTSAYRFALGALVVAPAIIIMPPRKLDWYTFGLSCTWVYCLNHVMEEQGGGIFYRLTPKSQRNPSAQERLRKEFEDDDLAPSEYIMKTIKDVWNQEGKKSKWAKEFEEKAQKKGEGVPEALGVAYSVQQLEKKKLEEKAAQLPEPAKKQPLFNLPERITGKHTEVSETVSENLQELEKQKQAESDRGSLLSASDHTQPPWEEKTPVAKESKSWWKVW